MNLAGWLARWRPAPLPRNRELEFPRAAATTAQSVRIICPRCESYVALDPLTCTNCGFPFICDIAPIDTRRIRRRAHWRTLVAIAALLFWLGNALFVASGTETYQGTTASVVTVLKPDAESGIPLSGPGAFVARTQLALALLKSRAPDFYYRLRQSVTSIDYLGERLYDERNHRQISLEGIGALSTPDTGRVQVLMNTAFPSGLDELTDGDVFNYAGVLVHELRHIELHHSGQAPGGWQEEVLCEQAAYSAEQAMDAPGAILARYQMYLHNPQARQYQHWYKWYDQFK